MYATVVEKSELFENAQQITVKISRGWKRQWTKNTLEAGLTINRYRENVKKCQNEKSFD